MCLSRASEEKKRVVQHLAHTLEPEGSDSEVRHQGSTRLAMVRTLYKGSIYGLKRLSGSLIKGLFGLT